MNQRPLFTHGGEPDRVGILAGELAHERSNKDSDIDAHVLMGASHTLASGIAWN